MYASSQLGVLVRDKVRNWADLGKGRCRSHAVLRRALSCSAVLRRALSTGPASTDYRRQLSMVSIAASAESGCGGEGIGVSEEPERADRRCASRCASERLGQAAR